MLQFTRFLIEEEHKMKLGHPSVHINHLEDSIMDQGHEGVHQAADFLDDAHQMLSGHKPKNDYTTKFDGSPSFVFGIHPHSGQFFVSSPKGGSKVNHSPEDIVNNHANNPRLAAQLISALSELPKIMPKNAQPGEVYQGDMMHTPDSIFEKDGHIHFRPNQIVYSAKSNSPEGKAAQNSRLGLVTHTMFTPDGMAHPLDKKARSRFVNHPDVHHIDPTFTPESGTYQPAHMNAYLKHRSEATKHYATMAPESLDAAMVHAPEIIRHINDQITAGKPYNAKSLITSLNANHSTRMKGINNEKWKKQRMSDHSAKVAHLLANEKHIEKAMKLHKHIMDAKNVLADAMGRNTAWVHSINGQITPPEGIVSVAPGGSAVKFVQRQEFAKHGKKKSKS